MTGVEIDLVVTDSLKALTFYQTVFGAETVEVTGYDQGLNEAVFNLHGTRFHLLDENPQYHLIAPRPGDNKSSWINVLVEDIRATMEAAEKEGITVVQEIVEMPEMGGSNAMFVDPFGHLWLLHEIRELKSFEQRTAYMEEQMKEQRTGN